MPLPRRLRPHHVAALLNVSERRVRIWLLEGRLKGTRAPFGQWSIPARELDRFLNAHGTDAMRERWQAWQKVKPP